MANRKITELTALTAPAVDDILPIIDISEGADVNKNKKITYAELLASAPDGTVGAPGFSFNSATSTGLYKSAANEISIATNGGRAIQIEANNKTTIYGDLVVTGGTTTVSSTTITVADKNLELATGNSSDAGCDGGGLTLKGASDKEWKWIDSSDSWTSNQNIDIATGKVYKVAGSTVLTETTLGSGVVGSSLTSVGTLGTLAVTGEIDAGSLDISGNADIDGTLETDALTIDGTALNEYIADTVGAMVSGNTETNIVVTYDDSDNTLDFTIASYPAASISGTTLASNVVTSSLTSVGTLGSLAVTNAVVAGSLDISGGADIDGTLEADAYTVDGTALNEYIADTVGAMVSSNTETDITVTYNDSDNTLDFVVGNIAGNAGTATALQTARTIGGVSFNGTANIDLPGVNQTGNQNTTGSAATLTTARTIGGVSFDGSANINLPGVNAAGNQNTSGTAAGLSGTPNITVGVVTAGSLDISGGADIDGTLEADAYTVDGTALNEYIADTVGAMVSSNTETNIAVTYDDADNTLDFVIGTLNQNTTGTAANLSGTPNITVGVVTAASLDISGNVDVDGTLETDALTINGTSLSETIADTVGAMVTSNTETGITVTYDDADNTLDFVVGTLNQNTTGNAATATALQTARTINGVSFDGTGNITIADSTKLPLAGGTLTGNISGIGFLTASNVNSTGDSGLSIKSGSRLGFDQSGTRSWTIKAASGNLIVASGDGSGAFQATLFHGSGANLTNLHASNLATGTIAEARLSTAVTQSAGNNSTKIATTAYVETAVANLVDGSPGALNTLNELAAALGDDANFSTTVTNSIATKLPLAGGTLTGDVIFSGQNYNLYWDKSVDALQFSDNAKATFGNHAGAGDLQIYHNGTNTFLTNTTGYLLIDAQGASNDLVLRAGNDVLLQPKNGENGLKVIGDGACELYFDSNKKLETTTNGVTITGGIIAGGLTYPTSDGSNGQVLKTNGSGTLSWTTPISAGSDLTGSSLASNIVSSSLTSVGTLTGLTTSGNILMTGTGCIDVAAGTSAQRPGSPNAGMFRFNTTDGKFEGHDGSSWGEIGGSGGGGASFYINTLSSSSGTGGGSATFNGTAYRFTISNAPATGNAAQMLVSVGGVIQKANSGTSQPSEGYAISGNDIIFGAAPASAASWFIITYGALNAGTPTDSTVSEAKLQVSNSPTNGYFLSAQSGNTGGLTWAAVDLSSKLSLTGGTLTGSVKLNDSVELLLGTGNDFKLRHDGTDNHIASANGDININVADTETAAVFEPNGAVKLYYDNGQKFSTRSDGVKLDQGHFYADDHSRIKLGNGPDLEIYHDASHSYISHTNNANDLRIRGAYVKIQGANGENMLVATQDAAVGIYHDNSIKLHTASDGVSVTGVINNQHLRGGSGDMYVGNAAQGDLYIYVQDNTNNSIILQANTGEKYLEATMGGAVDLYHHGNKKLETRSDGILVSGNIQLNDNNRLDVGNNGDLQIKHDGSNSYLSNSTGNLMITGNNSDKIHIRAHASKQEIVCFPSAGVQLFYDDAKKFETTSSGVAVTGALTTTQGATITGNTQFNGNADLRDNDKVRCGASQDLQIWHDASGGNHSYIFNYGAGVFKIADDTQLVLGKTSNYNYINCTPSTTELFAGGNKRLSTNGNGITIHSANNEGLVITGSNDPYILFQEGTTNKAWIQWSTGGFLELRNSEAQAGLRLQDDLRFTTDNWSSTNYKIWNEGNDGSGSGLDADTLDGVQGSSYLRSDTTDTASGALTFTATALQLSSHYYHGYYSGTTNYIHLYPNGTTGGDRSITNIRSWNGSSADTFQITGGSATGLKWRGNTIWTAENDGAGSGLDADLWDGDQKSTYLNQAVLTSSSPTFNNIYSNDWFRNNVSGQGLYNQSTGQHFYSDNDDYWNIAGGTGANALLFRDEHGGTIRGYVWADNSSNVGFLNNTGNWALRCNSGRNTYTYGHLYPNTNNSFDLGASGNRWNNLYVNDMHFSNEGKEGGNDVDGTTGDWTLQEGADTIFMINNKTGKKYKMALQEVF